MTFRPVHIAIMVDVSDLSLIDAEKYYRSLNDFPMPGGCNAAIMMDVEEVEE